MTSRRAVLAASGAGIGGLVAGSPAHALSRARHERGSQWQRLPDVPANKTDWSDLIPVGEAYWTQLGKVYWNDAFVLRRNGRSYEWHRRPSTGRGTAIW